MEAERNWVKMEEERVQKEEKVKEFLFKEIVRLNGLVRQLVIKGN